MRSGFGTVVVTLAVLTASTLVAQDADPPAWDAPGSRVRAETPRGTVKGTVVARTGDALALRLPSGEQLDVPLASIERLERSLGRETPRGLQAAWVGLGVGLGAAVATTRVDRDDCGLLSDAACSRKEAIGTGVLVSLLFLALAQPPTVERWEAVPTAGGRAQWTIAPRVGPGVGVELGLSF